MTLVVDVGELTQLQALVDAVEHGAEVTVTRAGRVVARLVQAAGELDGTDADAVAAMRDIDALSEGLTLGPGLTLRDLIDDGRSR